MQKVLQTLFTTRFLGSISEGSWDTEDIYIYAFSRRFYPKWLTVHSGYTIIVSMCVPWELNPQPLRC